MNCQRARLLLEQGIAPGGEHAEQAQLGFHLAACEDCRRYRVLTSLLATLPDPEPSSRRWLPRLPRLALAIQTDQRLSVFQRVARLNQRAMLPRMLRLAASAIGLLVLLVVMLVAGIALRTYRNMSAMIEPAPIVAAPPTQLPMLVPSATIAPTSALAADPDQPEATRLPALVGTVALPPRPTVTQAAATLIGPPALPTGTAITPLAERPITILVLGLDRRPGETTPPATDAIIVLHLDPVHGRVAMLSLPRDLWVDIPGYEANRINTAFATGESSGLPGAGPELARHTVSRLLGMPIDAYVVVDFQGFIKLIDAIGGITVDIERELYDDHYPTMDHHIQEVYFAPGVTHLDGATALIYARIRHSDSDFQRIQRQQQVLAAIMARLEERGALRNLIEADKITWALRDYVRTNLPHEQALGFVWALRSFDPMTMKRLVVSPDMISAGIPGDAYAEVPNLKAIRQLAAQLALQ